MLQPPNDTQTKTTASSKNDTTTEVLEKSNELNPSSLLHDTTIEDTGENSAVPTMTSIIDPSLVITTVTDKVGIISTSPHDKPDSGRSEKRERDDDEEDDDEKQEQKQMKESQEAILVRRRAMNTIHSRRKRERQRIEIEVLKEQCTELTKKNVLIQQENGQLEYLLETIQKTVSNSTSQQQQQQQQYSTAFAAAPTLQHQYQFLQHQQQQLQQQQNLQKQMNIKTPRYLGIIYHPTHRLQQRQRQRPDLHLPGNRSIKCNQQIRLLHHPCICNNNQ
jgi:hypothetical protein